MNSITETLPVAIIGAGPVGLAAAAHLLKRGERPVVFELGESVASSVREWAHVRMFSPWKYNIDSAAKQLLEQQGWNAPDPEHLPTGEELIEDYLAPLAAHPCVASCLNFGCKVLAISRKGVDKVRSAGRNERAFLLRVEQNDIQQELPFRAVIDASGTWNQPNPMGSNGLQPIGEEQVRERIDYGIPDIRGSRRIDYQEATVLVVGSGHSSFTSVLDLLDLKKEFPKTKIIWAMRKQSLDTVFGGGVNDTLPARGEMGMKAKQAVKNGDVELITPLEIERVASHGDMQMKVLGTGPEGACEFIVDRAIVKTGFRPELSMLREIRVEIDGALESVRALAPMIDPNEHSCGSVPPHGARELAHPEKGFYIVGMKSYGRAPTFLLATGHEQVRSVVAEITGDHEAAAKVELRLPETGVCQLDSTPSCDQTMNQSPCCSETPKESVDFHCCTESEVADKNQKGDTCCE
ncbi:NAD(P)-binding domain-containing protein [Rubritalea spongiae]|uniref:NAD(P)-binding domain-containing protein n=1 Tax=Rubritalea spongiae TaxID=430797 RepID=A0ABW5DZ69_9BACT